MSLYRTWRPKSFTDLVGQDAVVRTLRTALSSGKLAHAYLFSGPRGSGKTSAAKILARCIDCVHGPTPEPDNTCENCLAMLAGTALDVVEIDAASNRGIDEIRALRESVKFAPASMRMKVFIIDEAHMLTREGANAFLKTLEEPPPHVIFILATTAPEALPATILSRCQRYAFRRIPVVVMIARMREIADAEGIAIDDGALGALAYRADGGLRDALTMLEQVASYAGGAVDAATVEAAFGATGREYARALVAAILGANAAAALRVVDEASDAGADMLGLIRGAIGEYRNLLVARIEPDLLSRDLSQGDAAAAAALAAATPQPKVVRGLRLLADALAAGRSSGNPRLELETAVLRLIVATEDPSLEALATRVALLESAPFALRQAQGDGLRVTEAEPVAPTPVAPSPAEPVALSPAAAAPSPAPAAALRGDAAAGSDSVTLSLSKGAPSAPSMSPPATPTPTPPPAPTLQQVRSMWKQVQLRVEEQSKPLKGPLSGATVDALQGNALALSVRDEVTEAILRPHLAIVESAVAAVVGVPLRLVLRNRSTPRGAVSAPLPLSPSSLPPPSALPVAPEPGPREVAPEAASAEPGDGEVVDLLAYARSKIGGTDNS